MGELAAQAHSADILSYLISSIQILQTKAAVTCWPALLTVPLQMTMNIAQKEIASAILAAVPD
jgi:hypothetical protein